MRLIDADELLHDVIGITDGWLRPPKKVIKLEDLIRIAPTIIPCDKCPYIKDDRISRSSTTELG